MLSWDKRVPSKAVIAGESSRRLFRKAVLCGVELGAHCSRKFFLLYRAAECINTWNMEWTNFSRTQSFVFSAWLQPIGSPALSARLTSQRNPTGMASAKSMLLWLSTDFVLYSVLLQTVLPLKHVRLYNESEDLGSAVWLNDPPVQALMIFLGILTNDSLQPWFTQVVQSLFYNLPRETASSFSYNSQCNSWVNMNSKSRFSQKSVCENVEGWCYPYLWNCKMCLSHQQQNWDLFRASSNFHIAATVSILLSIFCFKVLRLEQY